MTGDKKVTRLTQLVFCDHLNWSSVVAWFRQNWTIVLSPVQMGGVINEAGAEQPGLGPKFDLFIHQEDSVLFLWLGWSGCDRWLTLYLLTKRPERYFWVIISLNNVQYKGKHMKELTLNQLRTKWKKKILHEQCYLCRFYWDIINHLLQWISVHTICKIC